MKKSVITAALLVLAASHAWAVTAKQRDQADQLAHILFPRPTLEAELKNTSVEANRDATHQFVENVRKHSTCTVHGLEEQLNAVVTQENQALPDQIYPLLSNAILQVFTARELNARMAMLNNPEQVSEGNVTDQIHMDRLQTHFRAALSQSKSALQERLKAKTSAVLSQYIGPGGECLKSSSKN